MEPADSYTSIRSGLEATDAEERRQATSRLGGLRLELALPLLVRALGDEDWRVRKEATIAARAFGHERALVGALVELLGVNDNVGLRNAAVEVLAGVGPAATPALADALAALDADGRKLVVEALGRARDAAALGPLAQALDDPDQNVRQGAIEAVAQIGAVAREPVQEILLERLDDPDRLVRLTALEGLTALEVPIPWRRLEPLLEDPTLRPAALSAAALSQAPEAARALARALGRSRGGAFAQALAALARLSDGPAAVEVAAALRAEGPELAERLVELAAEVGDPGRRIMALRLAAAAGARGAVTASVAALGDELIAEPAQHALELLGAAALPEMLAELQGGAVPLEARALLVDVVASVAQDAVQHSPSPAAVLDPVLDALRAAAGGDDPLATSALVALSRLGEARDLDLAAAKTRSCERPVALAAEAALAALAGRFPAAARALVDAWGAARPVQAGSQASPGPELPPKPPVDALTVCGDAATLPAVIVVGALGAAEAFEERDAAFLARAATAGDTRARRAAVEAVSELGASAPAALPVPTAIEVLSFALADEEREVRLAAARALGRLSASAPERAGDILETVDRSGATELVAATVRAIGEGVSHASQERRSAPPAAPDERLVAALGLFAKEAAAPVANAAVDALGLAAAAGSPTASAALLDAFDHPDAAVVKAALLKLVSGAARWPFAAGPRSAASASPRARDVTREALERGLGHPSPAVRMLAVEILADDEGLDGRERLAMRLGVETDRDVRAAIDRALGTSLEDSQRQSGNFWGEGGR